MDSNSSLLVWVIAVSGVVAITLILTVGAVIWFHQKREAEQTRAWGRNLLLAQEEERHNIARDIHDDMVQRLTGVQLRLNPDTDPLAVNLLREVSRDLRTLARDLYPPALASISLGEALHDLATNGPELPVMTVDCDNEIELPKPETITLFRVAQEGLQNMQKHSRASRGSLVLARVAGSVVLTLADEGQGFESEEALRRSFGLRSMRERLGLVGGSLAIVTAPGHGTTITARVPVK